MRTGYWPRRIARNAAILVLALLVHLVVVTATSHSNQVMYRLSMATGYASVVLIAWAMLIGPWRVLRGRTAPVSTDLRRDVGIWGGLLAFAHVVTGLQVHLKGHMLRYFLYQDDKHVVPVRYDLFGFANWTGLAATLVILMLVAISNDASLRALGSRRWKSWQRWTYWAGVLVVAHTLAYQLPTKRHGAYIAAFAVVAVIVVAFQLDGRRRVLARARRDGSPTAVVPS
jgi:methionine sulfoxide reductase heme-binding subunit